MSRDGELQEAARCAQDFYYFASRYLKIVTKDSQLRLLSVNNAQGQILTIASSMMSCLRS